MPRTRSSTAARAGVPCRGHRRHRADLANLAIPPEVTGCVPETWAPVAIAAWLGHLSTVASEHDAWMALALVEAERAGAAGEVPIGAVVVRDGVAVAAAGNAPIAAIDPTAHAEVLALRAAARALGNYRMPGAVLYATVEPCAMCIGAALQARITTLVFGCHDPKAGAAGSLYDLTQDGRLNHRIRVVSGIEADHCRALMQRFFASRR